MQHRLSAYGFVLVTLLSMSYSCSDTNVEIYYEHESDTQYLDAKVHTAQADMQSSTNEQVDMSADMSADMSVDMLVDMEIDQGLIFSRDECLPDNFTWIDVIFNISPVDLTPLYSILGRFKAYIDCASQDASIFAILTNLTSITLTDSLIAAAHDGVDVHLILANPQQDLLERLENHLPNEVHVCQPNSCVFGKTLQESNLLLISKMQLTAGEREGTVIITSDPLLEQAESAKLYDLFARNDDLDFYHKVLNQWQRIKTGQTANHVRAEHAVDLNNGAHLLWTALDIHAEESSLNQLLESYGPCSSKGDANFFIVSHELNNDQLFLVDHMNRLQGSCNFKFLVNRISPELATALGNRVRVINHLQFGFSAVIGSATVSTLDNVHHEEVYTGTKSWLSNPSNYEGGVFWAWNEDLRNAYLNPLWNLWQNAQVP